MDGNVKRPWKPGSLSGRGHSLNVTSQSTHQQGVLSHWETLREITSAWPHYRNSDPKGLSRKGAVGYWRLNISLLFSFFSMAKPPNTHHARRGMLLMLGGEQLLALLPHPALLDDLQALAHETWRGGSKCKCTSQLAKALGLDKEWASSHLRFETCSKT